MKKYKMSPHLKKYYDRWITSNTPLGVSDIDKFYDFIKVCVKRGGKKHWNGARLRYFLEQDFPQRFPKDYADQLIIKAVSIFDHILYYERSSGYNYSLEQIEPAVKKESGAG
jgi:hypothetical protein